MHIEKLNLTSVLLCLLGFLLTPTVGLAVSERTAARCDAAARSAAADIGVPLDVMLAVTRAETGRTTDGRFQPWPWTVNMAGQGHWFSTRQDAYDYVLTQFNAGLRNFDIGCFQINHRWHADGFASLEAMFDPQQNALYAARFLRRLHSETGDWPLAIGAYHSRTPKYAKRYRARVDRVRARMRDDLVPRKARAPFPLAHRAAAPQAIARDTSRPWFRPRASLFSQAQARPLIDMSVRRSVTE